LVPPDHHKTDYVNTHAEPAKKSPQVCLSCHEQTMCDSCHTKHKKTETAK